MLLIGSSNALIGFAAAIEILEDGGSALGAVETAVRIVEDNPDDHTVGYGGYPNLRGEVELDACIIDGTTRRTGAVAALKGFRHPISVARAVMDQLPHVLLAGQGAATFAAECGFGAEDLLTAEAEAAWRAGISSTRRDGPLSAQMNTAVRSLVSDPEEVKDAGTVNVIAVDADGHMATAVSTSGWAFKYPGRVGDSPIAGAGSACDDRAGAAACTGFGELAIRASTAGSIVGALRRGVTLLEACEAAMLDVIELGAGPEPAVMNIIALDVSGNHCAMSTAADRTYAAWEGSGEPRLLPRTLIRR